MNDLDDVELDRTNPRKGRYLVGSDADNITLRHLVVFACGLSIVLLCILLQDMFLVVASAIFIFGSNFLYNLGPRWRAGPPPLDLLMPLSYLWVLWFAPAVNGTAPVRYVICLE